MKEDPQQSAENQLLVAEQSGLRLAILCRSAAIAVAFVWFVWVYEHNLAGKALLLGLLVMGVVYYFVIGTQWDRGWIKYTIFAADMFAVCAVFALVPVSRGEEVPQIIAFRSYGIYFLFPLLGLASLARSWVLMVWVGFCGVIGWFTAFFYAIRDIKNPLSWYDMTVPMSRRDYEETFLSIDFVGTGNRVEETAALMTTALILALAVYRSRQVFLARIKAEQERQREQSARTKVTSILGRYVPQAVAEQLVGDDRALRPQTRHAAILLLDIQDFTAFSEGRDPAWVIERLNGFLAGCADIIGNRKGVVISFTGDGLLASFNTPLEMDRPEAAALACSHELHAFAHDEGFAVRLGLASGPVASGSVGSARRQAFTVYGEVVNRAARLEALAKELGEVILLDDATAKAIPDTPGLRHCGPHELKGFAQAEDVWAAAPDLSQNQSRN